MGTRWLLPAAVRPKLRVGQEELKGDGCENLRDSRSDRTYGLMGCEQRKVPKAAVGF